jgi:ABC-type antimicrobial peptide transport system permease subunit
MRPEGESADGDRAIRGSFNIVSTGFLEALGIELVDGRDFRDDEFLAGPASTGVVIVSESAARALFPNGSAVGSRIDTGTREPRIAEIVGVVRDVRLHNVREPGGPLLLEPFGRAPWLPSTATLYLRANRHHDAIIASIRGVAGSLDDALPLYDVQPVSDRLDQRLITERRLASAAVLFALIALVLAAVGLYGVMAFAVALRSREFGVRIALGARAATVHLLVLRNAFATAAAGVGLGLFCSAAVVRLVSSRLWGLEPFDPTVFAACALVLFATAMLASWLPALRATRVDPITVLRHDST